MLPCQEVLLTMASSHSSIVVGHSKEIIQWLRILLINNVSG